MSSHFATCIVRSAWDATEETGLTIKIGDIIRITDSETYENWEDNDWWYGTNPESSLSGWFPSTFTELIDKNEAAAAAVPSTEEPTTEETQTADANSDSVSENVIATNSSVPEIAEAIGASVPETVQGTDASVPEIVEATQEPTETNQNSNQESVTANENENSDPESARAVEPAAPSSQIAIASNTEETAPVIDSEDSSTQNNSNNTTDKSTSNTATNATSNAVRAKATIDQISSLRRAIAKLEIKKQHLVDLDDFSRCTKVQLEIEATKARITQLENYPSSHVQQVNSSSPRNVAQPDLNSPKSGNIPPTEAKASSPHASTPPQLSPPRLSGTNLSSSALKPDDAPVSTEASESNAEESPSPVRRVRRADDLFNEDGTLTVPQTTRDRKTDNSAASAAAATTTAKPTDLLADPEESPTPPGVRVVNKRVRLNKISMTTVNASSNIRRSTSSSSSLPDPVFKNAHDSSSDSMVAALLSPPAGCHHGVPSGIMDMDTMPPLSLGSSRALVSPARSATRGVRRKRHFAEFPSHTTRMVNDDARIAALLQEEELRRERQNKREARRKQKQDAQIALMLQEVAVLFTTHAYMCILVNIFCSID